MRRFILCVLLLSLHQPSWSKTTYKDIPEGQSPFSKTPPQADPALAQQQKDLYGSGLYKNPPNVHVPSAGAGTSSAGNGLTKSGLLLEGPKVYYGKDGLEYDIETGLATGNVDPYNPPQGTSSSGTAGTSSSGGDGAATGTGAGVGADPSENVPAGYTAEAQTVTAGVTAIRQLVATAAAKNAIFKPLGLAEMEAGEKAYSSGHKACIESQASASTWCRDETNPELQTTLMMINGATAAMNSLAVKDACSTMSKVMSMAQLGMTAYTVSCGAMKGKCDLTCGKVVKGMEGLKAGLAKPYSCIPANLMLPSGCPEITASYEAQAKKIVSVLEKEMIPTDKMAIAGKAKLCSTTYAGLLASAGLSIVSIVKSLKDSRDCEKDSDGLSGGGGTETAAASSGSSSSSNAGASGGTGDTAAVAAGTPATTTPESSVPSTEAAATTPASGNESTRVSEVKKLENSPYAAYLPGGEKDPQRSVAGESAWRKEVTGAGGKSNWLKTRERYKDFDALP